MDENKEIVNSDGLCWHCLQIKNPKEIHTIHFGSLGYGSSFDNFSSQLQLCNDCIKETNPEWWELEREKLDFDGSHNFYAYKYEDEIMNYIGSLPLASRELFYNTYAYGACADSYIDSQDWIDYELGILSHEKCKEYGFTSPQESKAYKQRFPTCNHVYKKIYHDGSSACYCPYGASGNSDGTCNANISDECYMCEHYTPKENSMIIINEYTEFIADEKIRLQEMLAYATYNLNLINTNPEEYFNIHN